MLARPFHRVALAVVACLLPLSGASAELLRDQSFASQALGAPLAYDVYLPPGYAESGERYPVLYLLHGVGGNRHDWPDLGHVEATAEQLIESGQIEPLIIVSADGATSWYVDSADVGGPGDYATATREELIAHVDAAYRTRATRNARAIGGLSMGGFGALRLAFERPDLYAAAVSLSAALWSRLTDNSVLNERQEAIFQGSFGTPFDARRFRRMSPENERLIESAKAHPERLAVYLGAGDDDHFRAYASTFDFFMRLRERGLPVELRIADGGHDWTYWSNALPDVLRFVDREFARDRGDVATSG